MFQFLQHHGLQPGTARHIANNGWHQSTGTGYATCTHRWLRFCAEAQKDKYDMNVDNCLEFFSFLTNRLHIPLSHLRICRSFLSISRKLARMPYSENDIALLKKYLNGVINEKPQMVKKPHTSWDVECLLKYFQTIPDNNSLPIPTVAGKLALLILLSTMCRSGEVVHLRMSQIEILHNGRKVVFHIPTPTKTMNFDTFQHHGLQHLTISKLPEEPKICPVQCLQDYIHRTNTLRCGEDKLFIIAETGKGAARQTVLRWICRHFKNAGILNYAVHSTCAASSTTALLMGMSVDEIVAKVGWLNNTTFVRVYMRPLQKFTNTYSTFAEQKKSTHPRIPDNASKLMSKFKINKKNAVSKLQVPQHPCTAETTEALDDSPNDNRNTQALQQQWRSDKRVRVATDKIKAKTNNFLKFHRFTPAVRTPRSAPVHTPENTAKGTHDSPSIGTDSDTSLCPMDVKSKLKETILQRQVPMPGDLCGLTTDDIMNTSFLQDTFSDKDLQDITSEYQPREITSTPAHAEMTADRPINVTRLSKAQRQGSDTNIVQNISTKLPITQLNKSSYITNKVKWDNYSPKYERGLPIPIQVPTGQISTGHQTINGPDLPTQSKNLASASSTHMEYTADKLLKYVSWTPSPYVTYPEKGHRQIATSTGNSTTTSNISYIQIPLDQVMQTRSEIAKLGSTGTSINIWDTTQNKFVTVYPPPLTINL